MALPRKGIAGQRHSVGPDRRGGLSSPRRLRPTTAVPVRAGRRRDHSCSATGAASDEPRGGFPTTRASARPIRSDCRRDPPRRAPGACRRAGPEVHRRTVRWSGCAGPSDWDRWPPRRSSTCRLRWTASGFGAHAASRWTGIRRTGRAPRSIDCEWKCVRGSDASGQDALSGKAIGERTDGFLGAGHHAVAGFVDGGEVDVGGHVNGDVIGVGRYGDHGARRRGVHQTCAHRHHLDCRRPGRKPPPGWRPRVRRCCVRPAPPG